MVKTKEMAVEAPDLRPKVHDQKDVCRIPAHQDFRGKYFAGFNKRTDIP